MEQNTENYWEYQLQLVNYNKAKRLIHFIQLTREYSYIINIFKYINKYIKYIISEVYIDTVKYVRL